MTNYFDIAAGIVRAHEAARIASHQPVDLCPVLPAIPQQTHSVESAHFDLMEIDIKLESSHD